MATWRRCTAIARHQAACQSVSVNLVRCDVPRPVVPRQPLLVSVRRSALLEDANAALGGVGPDIRRPLRVSFISEHGYEEAGVDQGGLTKEFLEEACCPPSGF